MALAGLKFTPVFALYSSYVSFPSMQCMKSKLPTNARASNMSAAVVAPSHPNSLLVPQNSSHCQFCRFERGKHKYAHVLDGDGYVCSFSFDDQGRVHFRSAYVKTRYVSVASSHMTAAAACKSSTVMTHAVTAHHT